MDTAVARQLVDKIYEKRKAAALDLEKQIRECHLQGEQKRISQIIDQLVEMFSNTSNPLHVRNGGLIGLAGTAIALNVDMAPYMEKFIRPLLECFVDPENRIRYFSAECLYNIAKVSKGEILVFFNDIFDALSKLAADSELSVKHGAELLDRLLKDIVAESASVYIPQYPETEKIRDDRELEGVLVPLPDSGSGEAAKRAFSLAHFIPLLRERIYVVSPFTRSYLVAWITVLDSVPELELISYLPEFFDGLLKYLSDPTEDVTVATENLLADFLREIKDVTIVSRQLQQQTRPQPPSIDAMRRPDIEPERLPDLTLENAERALYMLENDENSVHSSQRAPDDGFAMNEKDTGAWIPGQGVNIDYAAIIEILIQQLDGEHDEIQQSTALRWLAEFLTFVHEVMVPFTPRLIPAILPNLAHHVTMIQSAAIRTNKLLLGVIQKLPSPLELPPKYIPDKVVPAVEKSSQPSKTPRSPTPTMTATAPIRQSTLNSQLSSKDGAQADSLSDTSSQTSQAPPVGNPPRLRLNANIDPGATPRQAPQEIQPTSSSSSSRPHSPISATSLPVSTAPNASGTTLNGYIEEVDPFDYQATVTELTVQFLSEFEETRVAALKWLIMLHQKAPKKILAMDDGTFPALLKTLSDSSEEVIKHDLQLLAQISSSSEETYFKAFMMNLLELFSTDRRLLETRGSLIIRQLCLNLNTERIYRMFAEIIEKEEDLEFASVIVQKLNMILITSPELADFRKRLKNLETRQDGQTLFTALYRSWCHNAVAVFSLCLLAQAYEHASNLLQIFADLEITVPMLVQVDKLVQLIESPVFTYLRLQLLEPERYPYLFKCLYGILMLLPQSSAFISLRNRLNAINSAGFLQIAPKSSAIPGRSKLGRDEMKWQELLLHFRQVQAKHEKARRLAMGNDSSPILGALPDDRLDNFDKVSGTRSGTPANRPNMRRRVTGEMSLPPNLSSSSSSAGSGSVTAGRAGALSPLNPQRRPPGALSNLMSPGIGLGPVPSNLNPAALTQAQKQRRPVDLVKKS
ncbi:vacuolar protein 14 C-terminal Fig4p binding-domain-containing protein [Crepidotus variabilis]|uniref:Vacuolar protein 14 C-terminal Fig4p binding-domain-containing protein n=1 Tax=Crepidotus variabilis TaxID=179855 RepID=A0A9P6EFE7_9AGAR|nr:vacuolar protein 14 C-terminal Fig4p binding-domain-containing protein [Crepidotus variabilis]